MSLVLEKALRQRRDTDAVSLLEKDCSYRWGHMAQGGVLLPQQHLPHSPLYLLHCICSSVIYGTPFSGLEKERATHSSTLAWKIPWM